MVEFILANFWLVMFFIAVCLADFRIGAFLAGILMINGGELNIWWTIFFMIFTMACGSGNYKKIVTYLRNNEE